jgi:NAD(P)-dependent dehydrogenase (short-subunit alcohol dehydrogenase family)
MNGDAGGPLELRGRVALVTGAGRGIGRAIALRLAEHGVDVAPNDLEEATSERTAEDIRALGRRAAAAPGDVSSADAVETMVRRAEDALGPIDILVNNAGISLYRPIAECSEEDWNRHVDIMAKGTFLTMRRVAPGMMARGWGRIVNLGSYVAQPNCVTKYFGPYCAAKFAVVGLTQVAAQEFAPAVTVNAVGPGDVDTDMMAREWELEGARRGLPSEQVKEEYRDRLMLGRFEEPADIAGAVLFLCSSLADQVTGSHLIVSGGLPFRRGE